VTGGAQLGLPDVRGLDLLEAGDRPHDGVPALSTANGPNASRTRRDAPRGGGSCH
jgi:hypothetical protein